MSAYEGRSVRECLELHVGHRLQALYQGPPVEGMNLNCEDCQRTIGFWNDLPADEDEGLPEKKTGRS